MASERMIESIDQSNWVLFVLIKYHDGLKWYREKQWNSSKWTAWTLDHLLNCDWWPFYVTVANTIHSQLHSWCAFIFHSCMYNYHFNHSLFFSLSISKVTSYVYFLFSGLVLLAFFYSHSQCLMHCNAKRGKVKWNCVRVSLMKHCLSIHTHTHRMRNIV